MALGYANLFEDLGKFIAVINACSTNAGTTIPGWESGIEAKVGAENGRYDVLEQVHTTFQGFREEELSRISVLAAKVEERLIHQDTVIEEIPWLEENAAIEDVLVALYEMMLDDSQTINAGSVTIPVSVTADAGNYTDDGTVFYDCVLDGASSPSSGWPVVPSYIVDTAGKKPGTGGYVGRTSELVSGAMVFECIADSFTDGATAGQERFDVQNGVRGKGGYDWERTGEGKLSSVTTMDSGNKLLNGGFEDFSVTNTPDNWTLGVGVVVGTHVLRNSTAAHVKRGTYSLKIVGDGALATIKLSQVVTGLIPRKRYVVGVWLKGGASVSAGALSLKMEGTGYTAGTNEQISLNQAALAALVNYGAYSFFFNVPEAVPSDFAIALSVTGPLANAGTIYVDGLCLAEAQWHGGTCFGIFPGAKPFLRGDKFTVDWALASEGAFQKFFRKWYGVQLPSDAAAGETISDTLVA